MASVAELCRAHAHLADEDVEHLKRLVSSWGLLADLSFADLLLFVPVAARPGWFVVAGQIRPTTSQTLHADDWVGRMVDGHDVPLVPEALQRGRIVEDASPVHGSGAAQRTAIPVRRAGQVLAVVARDASVRGVREPGELERTYLAVFGRLAAMLAAGAFPFAEELTAEPSPRVGDGVFVLGGEGRVEYASPNAVSALHRAGVQANVAGRTLGELGVDERGPRRALVTAAPVSGEVEVGGQVTLSVTSIPLVAEGRTTGAVVLARDISEVRQRDLLLLSKDATIREIHHRVKNNLQTISSLLRLQGRRSAAPEAKAAIEESVRRIGAIALVHETLSHEAGDDVAFVEILRPLARMVEEGLASPERPVRIRVGGDGGKLPAAVATPLAVVITELLQNAVEHAYPVADGDAPGVVEVGLRNDGRSVHVQVVDDGAGLPAGFRLDAGAGLGLTIVRTLVETELGGEIAIHPGGRGGTEVEVCVPLPGTPAAR